MCYNYLALCNIPMTLLLKGVVIMTLRELIRYLQLFIDLPGELEDIVIRNEADFCRYDLIGYFITDEFQYDMHTAKIYWDNNSYEGVRFYFIFHQDKEGLFSLGLCSEV